MKKEEEEEGRRIGIGCNFFFLLFYHRWVIKMSGDISDDTSWGTIIARLEPVRGSQTKQV